MHLGFKILLKHIFPLERLLSSCWLRKDSKWWSGWSDTSGLKSPVNKNFW